MKTAAFAAALSAVLALAPAHAQTFAPPTPEAMTETVATVNDHPISTYDVQQRMALIFASTGIQPSAETLPTVQAQALNSLISERLQMQEAAKWEVVPTEDEVNAQFDSVASQNNITRDAFLGQLRAAGIDKSTLEHQFQAEIAWNAMVSGLYGSRLRVSDDQIEDALSRFAESLSKPAYLISEIVLDPPAGATQAQINAGVSTIIEQLRRGAPFPEVARRFSASPSAAVGGDVGWVRAGELPDELESEIVKLQPGQITQPITTTDGIYLIALREVQQPTDITRLELRQVMIALDAPSEDEAADAQRALTRVADTLDSCDELESVVERRAPDAQVNTMGAIAVGDLSPEARAAVDGLEVGQMSAPFQTGIGVMALALCGRSMATGSGLPSREDIENSLLNEQLALASRRLLKRVREDATIEQF